MAQQALFQNTAKVRPFDDESAQYSVAPGKILLSCVRQGLLRQALSLVQGAATGLPTASAVYNRWRWPVAGSDPSRTLLPRFDFDGMELCAGYF